MPFVICSDSVIDAVGRRTKLPRNGKPHLQDRADDVFPSQAFGVDAPTNRPFQITVRLSSPDGEPQYRIRSIYEEHERTAGESELRPVQAYTP